MWLSEFHSQSATYVVFETLAIPLIENQWMKVKKAEVKNRHWEKQPLEERNLQNRLSDIDINSFKYSQLILQISFLKSNFVWNLKKWSSDYNTGMKGI